MLNTSNNGHNLEMELNTGASISTVPDATYRQLCPEVELEDTNVTLKPCGPDKMLIPRGKLTANVQYQKQEARLSMCVIGGDRDVPLFGRHWLSHFSLNWENIRRQTQPLTNHISATQDLSRQFPIPFSYTGKFKGAQARINIRKGTVSVYHKHHVVLFAIQKNVEEE